MNEIRKSLKVGEAVHVDGYDLTIMDISSQQTVKGRSIIIRAVDAESAQQIQAEQIKSEQMQEQVIETVKKMFGGLMGGNFPSLGGGE